MNAVKNLWDAAAQEVAYNEKNNETVFDKYVLLMGGKSSVSKCGRFHFSQKRFLKKNWYSGHLLHSLC